MLILEDLNFSIFENIEFIWFVIIVDFFFCLGKNRNICLFYHYFFSKLFHNHLHSTTNSKKNLINKEKEGFFRSLFKDRISFNRYTLTKNHRSSLLLITYKCKFYEDYYFKKIKYLFLPFWFRIFLFCFFHSKIDEINKKFKEDTKYMVWCLFIFIFFKQKWTTKTKLEKFCFPFAEKKTFEFDLKNFLTMNEKRKTDSLFLSYPGNNNVR